MNKAVTWGVIASFWQLFSAPITLFLISNYFSPELQGYHYTFFSLLGIQSFFELGLYVVILNISSHEWANLSLDKNGYIVGKVESLSRLVSLGRFIFKWYSIVSFLFCIIAGVIGYVFFLHNSTNQINWQGPWLVLTLLSGLQLWFLPFNSLLEGCDQVESIQKFRLGQIIIRSFVLWISLFLGLGLWASALSLIAGFFRDIYLYAYQYKNFFKPFFIKPKSKIISWKKEIWPLQSKLAVSGIFSYFTLQIFNPIIFHYHGPELAGKMGMTMSLIIMLQGLPTKWIQPNIPKYGILIAKREFLKLKILWKDNLKTALFISSLISFGFIFMVFLVNFFNFKISNRLLPSFEITILIIVTFFKSIDYAQTVFIRAFKEEPIFILSIVSSIIMGFLVWIMGKYFATYGLCIAYLFVTLVVIIPWQTKIFLRYYNRM